MNFLTARRSAYVIVDFSLALSVVIALVAPTTISSARTAKKPKSAVSAKAMITESAEIDMTFTDSSTPPKYHRSWQGSVRKGVFKITVGKAIVTADEKLCGGANPKAEAIDELTRLFVSLAGDFDTFAKRGQELKGSV